MTRTSDRVTTSANLSTAGDLPATERFTAMAVTSSFSPPAGLLSTLGDALDNNVTISRNAAGKLLVNGGAPTVANTSLIQVFGQGGNDTITLNEANGALPRANLFGGTGDDTMAGGSGADMLFGHASRQGRKRLPVRRQRE